MGYEENLDRALSETPDTKGSGSRFEVPDPDVRKDGNFTVVENFPDITDKLDRDPEHVLKHVQNELGTAAQLDHNQKARLTGEFRQSRVAEALEAYVEDFVICPECGLPDTRLETEAGVELLKCTACGARSSTGE